jgi:hypothetical protein
MDIIQVFPGIAKALPNATGQISHGPTEAGIKAVSRYDE